MVPRTLLTPRRPRVEPTVTRASLGAETEEPLALPDPDAVLAAARPLSHTALSPALVPMDTTPADDLEWNQLDTTELATFSPQMASPAALRTLLRAPLMEEAEPSLSTLAAAVDTGDSNASGHLPPLYIFF